MNIYNINNNMNYVPNETNDYIFTKHGINNDDDNRSFPLKNDNEKKEYIETFNKLTNTNFVEKNRERDYYEYGIKNFRNKLYKDEYNRAGEIQHLNDFCSNSLDIYNAPVIYKKNGAIRLMSFNIHAFIQSCNVYMKSSVNNNFTNVTDVTTNTISIKDVYKFLYKYDIDILGFQEYAPEFNDQTYLKISSFMDDFNKNIPTNYSKFKDYIISDCKEKQKSLTFFGNAIFSTFGMIQKYSISYPVPNDKPRCFIGCQIEKNNVYGAQKIYIFNIHPMSESVGKLNHTQINEFFDMLTTNLDPYKTNIIVMGDFNTSEENIHSKIKERGYYSVHELFEPHNEYLYSGYHGTLIDYVYVSDKFLDNYSPQKFDIININLSDHYPILFDFVPKNKIIELSLKETIRRYMWEYEKKIINKNLLTLDNLTNLIMNSNNKYDEILSIANKYGSIMNLHEGIYLAHGTTAINFNNSDIPFEISEELNKKDIPIVPKSFTLLHYPGESFSNYYGTNDKYNMKRLVIYKIKKTLPLVNLYKAVTLNERTDKRINFYYDLYEALIKSKYPNKFQSMIDKKWDPFTAMRILWAMINKVLLNITDTESGVYNKNLYYGTINTDFIPSDTTYLKPIKNHAKTHPIFPDAELYEGIEIQIFTPEIFLDFVGVYYNNKFYPKDDWMNMGPGLTLKLKDDRSKYLKDNNLIDIPNIRDSNKFPIPYSIKYSRAYIYSYFNFIISLMTNSIFSNDKVLKDVEFLIKKILHDNDARQSIGEPYMINIILNDFFEQIANMQYNNYINIENGMIYGGSISNNIYDTSTKISTKPLAKPRGLDHLANGTTNNVQYKTFKDEFKHLIENLVQYNPSDKKIKYILDKTLSFLNKVNQSQFIKPPITMI